MPGEEWQIRADERHQKRNEWRAEINYERNDFYALIL